MTYLPYIAAAYGIFVIAMVWDFLATRLRIAALLRAVRRARPRRVTTSATVSGEPAP